jgi:hypothetical protein
MKIAKEFLTALMTGKTTVDDCVAGKGSVYLDRMTLTFGKDTATLKYFTHDNILVSSLDFSFNPFNGNVLTLAATESFTMKLEVELSP